MEVQFAGSTSAPEFLDRHPWLPIVLLVLLPFAVSVPLWLFGFSTDPIWYLSGTTTASQPFPGFPFLDPNIGFTSEALGRLSAWDWVHGIVPWWNPYTGIGMPLAGEMQPGSFFLPFNLLFLLKEGVLWQKICMQIIAGLATYALLRELKLSRLASLMSGAVFAFNGTIAWTPGPAAGYCSLPFLPLLLWGIERARKEAGGAVAVLAIGCAIAWSILAGFPEPAYINGLLALAWGIYRLAGEQDRWGMVRRAATGFVLGLLVAAPLLIAFADYLQQSDSFSAHLLGELSLPLESFAQTMMPYVYGPVPTIFHSVPMEEMWGQTGGYAGTLLVLMAVVGLVRRSSHGRLRILLACWVGIAWAKSLGIQPIQGIMNFLPLLRRTAFFRYSDPSWIFALVVLAAFGLDELSAGHRDGVGDGLRDGRLHAQQSVPLRRRYPFAFVIALLVLAVAAAWPTHAFWARPASLHPLMFLLMSVSLAWVAVECLVAALVWKRLRPGPRRAVLAALLVFEAVAMFLVPQLSARHHTSVDTAAVRFLHDHQGLSRLYAIGALDPNYGAYFKVASIDHNSLPVPKLWAHYVDTNLLPGVLDKSGGVDFVPDTFAEGYPAQALRDHLPAFLELGVRFIAIGPGQSLVARMSSPAIDQDNQPVLPATQILLDRVKFIRPVLAWCRSVAGNAAAPAFEHALAAAFLKRFPKTAGSGAVPAATAAAASESDSLTLRPGELVSITAPALPSIPVGQPVYALAVIPLADGTTGAGELSVELCAGTVCQTGRRSLSEATASKYFSVPLDVPLAAGDHLPMRLTLSRRDQSSRPFSFRMRAASGAELQQIQTPAGPVSGHAVQLGFDYSRPLPGVELAYTDAQMELWQLPSPAPYFEVIHGGPCALADTQRETLTADCQSPATLMRRELFMPGWKASINGKTVDPQQQNTIFQAISLPAGHSRTTYHFVPPHMVLGWVLCAFGVAGLVWQLILVQRQRRGVHA